MNEMISYWFLQMLAMGLTALLIPRLRITGLFGALKIVAALAFLNATVWDAALFFSIPDAPTTQAATLLVVNGLIFWILVKLLDGIEVDGLLPAIVAPVVFTILSLAIDQYGREIDWQRVFETAMSIVERLRTELGGAPSGTPIDLEAPSRP
jgi:putative membrane protein